MVIFNWVLFCIFYYSSFIFIKFQKRNKTEKNILQKLKKKKIFFLFVVFFFKNKIAFFFFFEFK